MPQLSHTITRWQGTGLLATALLGSSVFILPQLTVEEAGSNSLFSWILLILAIMTIALTFGRLGAKFPNAGGPSFFVEQAFNKIMGEMTGLLLLVVLPLAIPIILILAFEFVDAMVPMTGNAKLIGELLLLPLLVMLNWHGLRALGRLQLILTILVSAAVVVLLLVYFSMFSLVPLIVNSLPTDFDQMFSAMAIAFWGFLGIEAMSHLSAEFKNSQQDFIPAMLIGTLIAGLVYFGCTLLILSSEGEQNLRMVDVFNTSFGSGGAWIFGILGLACSLATFNVYTTSAARLAWSLSKRGVLPRYYSTLNTHGVPMRAFNSVVSLMAVTLIIAYIYQVHYATLIRWTNSVFVIIYLVSMIAALRLLEKKYSLSIWISILVCMVLTITLIEDMEYVIILTAFIVPYLYVKKRMDTRAAVSQK